jgi:hypothetical protein
MSGKLWGILGPFREAGADLLKTEPASRRNRDRRSGRNFDQYIDSIEKAMASTKDPRARKAQQEKIDHVRERMRKFVRRKKSDRRSTR